MDSRMVTSPQCDDWVTPHQHNVYKHAEPSQKTLPETQCKLLQMSAVSLASQGGQVEMLLLLELSIITRTSP